MRFPLQSLKKVKMKLHLKKKKRNQTKFFPMMQSGRSWPTILMKHQQVKKVQVLIVTLVMWKKRDLENPCKQVKPIALPL